MGVRYQNGIIEIKRPIGAYAPVGGQRAEVRGREGTEVGSQRTEVRGQKSEVRKGQKSEVGKRQMSDVRCQKSDVGDLRFRHTWDIILAAERGLLPDKVMINTHPQRWDDKFGPWVKELVWQNVKNVVKYFYVRTLKR
jgi:hypothetical protein